MKRQAKKGLKPKNEWWAGLIQGYEETRGERERPYDKNRSQVYKEGYEQGCKKAVFEKNRDKILFKQGKTY